MSGTGVAGGRSSGSASTDERVGRWRLSGVRTPVATEIARREIQVLTRTRTWRIATALIVVLTAVGLALITVLGGGDGERRVVHIGSLEPAETLRALLEDPERAPFDIVWVRVGVADLRGALREGTVDVVVDPPRTLLWDDRVDTEIRAVLVQAIAGAVRAERLGLGPDDLGILLEPVEVRDQFVSEGLPTQDDDGTSLNAKGVGLILTILSFVGLQVYGTIVVAGVVKEKADHVVEVLLAHVRARELLAGKVAGVTAVATLQVAAVTLTAAAVLSSTGAVALPLSIWAIVPLAVVIFALGFGFFATLLAVAGSLVSRMEEGQFIALPVTLPMIGIYIAGLATVLPAPDTLASRVLSYVPVSSPLIMPIRVAAGSVAAWELALSVVLLLAATWWAIALAGRVYESTLLRTGTRTSWRAAVRLARRDPAVRQPAKSPPARRSTPRSDIEH